MFKFIRVILGMPSKSCCEKTYEETYESLSSEFTTKLEEAYSNMHADIRKAEETGLKGYEEAFAIIQDLQKRMSVARADYDTLLERYNEIYKNYHGHKDKSITRSAGPPKPRVECTKLPDGYLSAADLEIHSWGIRFTKQSGEIEWYNRKTNPRAPWGPIPTLLSEKEARERVLRYKTCIIAEELVGQGNWGIRYEYRDGQARWWHHPVDKVAWGLISDATVFTEEKAKEKAAYFVSGIDAVQVLSVAKELSLPSGTPYPDPSVQGVSGLSRLCKCPLCLKSHEEEVPEGWLIYYKEDKGKFWYLTDPHCYSWRDEVSKAHVFSEEEAATKLKEVNRGRKEVKYFVTPYKLVKSGNWGIATLVDDTPQSSPSWYHATSTFSTIAGFNWTKNVYLATHFPDEATAKIKAKGVNVWAGFNCCAAVKIPADERVIHRPHALPVPSATPVSPISAEVQSTEPSEPWVIQRNSTGNLYYKSKSGVVITLDFISKAAVFSEEEAKAKTKQLNSELTGEPYSAMQKEEKLRSNKSSKYERAKEWVIQRIQSDEQNFWFIRGKCTSWTGSIRCATLFSAEDAKAKVLQLEPGALPSDATFAHRVPKLKLDPVQKPEKQDKPSVEDEFLTDLKNMIG